MNEEQILAQAEQIARKAQTQGYESLTEEEKRILQMAQQIMQQYDMSSQGGGAPVDEGAGYGTPEAGVPAGGAPEMPVGGNQYKNGGKITTGMRHAADRARHAYDNTDDENQKARYRSSRNVGAKAYTDSVNGKLSTRPISAYNILRKHSNSEYDSEFLDQIARGLVEASDSTEAANAKKKAANKKSYGGNISIDKSELGAPFLKTKDASYYFL